MGEHSHVVTDKECVRHVRKLLAVLRRQVQRWGLLVRDDVVHEAGPARARVTQPHSLNLWWPCIRRKYVAFKIYLWTMKMW